MNDDVDRGLALYERWDPVAGFRMEYLNGEVVLTARPGMAHGRIVNRVRDRFPHSEFACWSHQAVAIAGRHDRPDPDLTVTAEAGADGQCFDAIPSRLVLFVLEVVHLTRASKRRTYEDKVEIYAQGGIPVYLLVDPNDGTWRLHSKPDQKGARYGTLHKGVFGEAIVLPEPLGLTVPTDRFLTYPLITPPAPAPPNPPARTRTG
jgi:Uma2 family endonuclease